MKMNFPKIDWHKIIHHVTLGLDLLLVLSAMIIYFMNTVSYWTIWVPYIFYSFITINTIFLASKIKQIPEDEREDSRMIYYFSHFFLLTLVIIVLNQFLKKDFIINNLAYLTAISVALGFLTFYAYRNKVERDIEKGKVDEGKTEKKRFDEFGEKFPRLNKVWGLRRFVRWMYKEGWWFSVGLIAIVVIGFILRIWGLDGLQPHVDEFYNLVSAKRFFIEGSFSTYNQGSLISYIIGLLFVVNGGPSLSLARLVIVLFGSLNIFLVYLLAKKINRKVGIISAILFSISPFAVGISRFVRYYEVYLTITLAYLILFISTLKNKNNRKIKIFLLAIIPPISFILMGRPEAIFFIFFEGFLFLLVYLPINRKVFMNRRALFLGIFAGIFAGIFIYYLRWLFSPSLLNNYDYFSIMFDPNYSSWYNLNWFNNLNILTSMVISLFILPLFILFKNKIVRWSYLSFSIFLVAFIFVIDYSFMPRYLYYIQPFYIIIFSISIYLLFSIFQVRKSLVFSKILVVGVIVVIFNPLVAIQGVQLEDTRQESISGLGHPDYIKLFEFIEKEGFNENQTLIVNFPYPFLYYYDYSFVENPWEDTLRNVQVEKYTGKVLFDYGNPYWLRSELVGENERVIKIVKNYSSGWIILEDDSADGEIIKGIIGKRGNITLSFVGKVYAGYLSFNVYSWEME